MLGILIAILAAFLQSIGDVAKKRISLHYHPYLVIWIPIFVGVLVNFSYLYFTGFPAVRWKDFLSCLIPAIALFVFIEIQFVKAIRSGDLSLVLPFTSFIPVFNTLFAWVLILEEPSPWAFVGIGVIVFGSWIMFLDPTKSGGILAPLKGLVTEAGPRHMLVLAFWNGFFTLLMKIGAGHSSAVFFFSMVLLGELLCFSVLLIFGRIDPLKPIREMPLVCLQAGVFYSLGLTLLAVAISMTLVAYASAAYRTHVIFVVLVSHFLLREGDFRRRLLAASIMIVGVLLVLLPAN